MSETSDPSSLLGSLERQLATLLADIRATDSEQLWREVEQVSQTLANGLRARDGPGNSTPVIRHEITESIVLVDNHTVLGRTALPQSLTSLFTLSLQGGAIPNDNFTSVVFEILRVAANICMDHGKYHVHKSRVNPPNIVLDENRGYLLEAGLPQALVSLLEGYSEPIPPPPHPKPLDISIPHLKVIRTAIGVLLNASIGFGATYHGC